MPNSDSTKQVTFGIIAALVFWGIYVAVGATGFWIDKPLVDFRKSFIVLACVALFLGLWAIVLRSTSQERLLTNAPRGWNRAALCTVGLVLATSIVWVAAVFSWERVSRTTTTVAGWTTAFLVLSSAVAGMIALSDRSGRKGKWWGILGFMSTVVSLITFVVRMTP